MSVTITPETEAKLQAFARETGRDLQDIVELALRQYMDHEEGLRGAIRLGLEQAERGETVPHEQVMAELEAILASREAAGR